MPSRTLDELIAAEKARAFAAGETPDLKLLTDDLEALATAGHTFSSELNLEDLVQKVTEAGVQITGATMGAFFYNTTDEQHNALKLFVVVGANHSDFEKFANPRTTPLLSPHQTPEGVIRVDDVTTDPRLRGMPPGHLPVRSYMAVPVITNDGRSAGALLFGHTEPARFSDRVERLAKGIAAQAAVAIDNATLYLAAQREIDRRRHAEITLELAQEASGIGTFKINQTTKEVVMSPRARLVFGFTESEHLTVEQVRNCYLEEYRSQFAFTRQDVPLGEVLKDEYIIRRNNDGALRWVLRHARFIHRVDTGGIELLGTVQDITDKKRQEELLRESEEHYRFRVELSPQTPWTADADGQLDAVGPRWTEWTGKPGTGEGWAESIHPDDLERSFAAWRHSVETGEPYDIEHRAWFQEPQEYRWVYSRAYPRYNADGDIVKWYGMTEIIHDRRLIEERLREMNETLEHKVRERTAELEQSNDRLLREINERQLAQDAFRQAQKMESVGQLTGGIAHDFNNMLTVIIGNLELIKLTSGAIGSANPATQRLNRNATSALDAAMKAEKLTAQLLAFSRKTRLQPQKVNVNAILPGVVEMIDRSLGKHITVKQDLADDLWLCLSDKSQLEVAIVNLALNARDAMPTGGEIIICTSNKELPKSKGKGVDRFVSVEVRDTGCGIPPEDQERIFDPFFTTKDVGKGTGLGLSMVYGFCQQSNGRVQVRSAVGQGTVVEMLFPYTQGEEVPDEAANDQTPEATGSRETILVVDDEDGVRELAVTLLQDLGYAVIQASNGQEAIEIIKNPAQRLDLVFSDIVMPGGVDGFEVCKVSEQERPLVPVLLTTGHAEALLKERPDDQISVPIIGKPYRLNELSSTISATLARQTKAA